MSRLGLDREVAYYVLAYLARQGYSHTMTAFLQECSILPANTTMMVLPETPLSVVIAEHKARKESELLLGKLGAQASWQALWEKLQHYLDQLRTLSATLLESQDEAAPAKKPTVRRRQHRLKTSENLLLPPGTVLPSLHSQRQQHIASVAHTPVSLSHPLTTDVPAGSLVCPLPSLPASSSPRKKRDPSRMQPHSDTLVTLPPPFPAPAAMPAPLLPAPAAMPAPLLPAPAAMPAPQQLLDILLDDESLQHRLAHLINTSLLSGGEAELTDDVLDDILAMTTSPDSAHILPVTTAMDDTTTEREPLH